MDIIKALDLKYAYARSEGIVTLALDGINLDIPKGQFVAILGHNGSGKSTLARHMNAILLPTDGKMFVNGMDTSDNNLLFDVRKNVSMVFQNPDNQIVATIVEEDVAFALENLGIEPEEIRRRVEESLKQVGMYDFKEHSAHMLSGGQKQRIAIAGVLATRPCCVVMDEPTAMLDPGGRKEIMNLVLKLKRELNITIVLITHHMDEATLCDRIIVMNKGTMLADGCPAEIFSKPDILRKVSLELPQTIEILDRLNHDKNAELSLRGLSVNECADVLEGYLKEQN